MKKRVRYFFRRTTKLHFLNCTPKKIEVDTAKIPVTGSVITTKAVQCTAFVLNK